MRLDTGHCLSGWPLGLPGPLGPAAPDRMGGLGQAALRRTGCRPRLSSPLHPPPSPTAASSAWTTTPSTSAGRTTAARPGSVKFKTMSLTPDEFLRRVLLHVLPTGFHRIRHYGLLAKGSHAIDLYRLRALIAARPAMSPSRRPTTSASQPSQRLRPCRPAPAAAAACASSRSSAGAARRAMPPASLSGSTPHERRRPDTPEPAPPSSFGHGPGPAAPHAADSRQTRRLAGVSPRRDRSGHFRPALAAAVAVRTPTARGPAPADIP
jgi:hypothetical protein